MNLKDNFLLKVVFPAGVASLFLFAALFNGWPYDFFTILRIVVTISAFHLGYVSYLQNKESYMTWVMVGIGILFNPIFPIYLSREVWVPIDIFTGFIFIASTLLITPSEKEV